MVESIEPFGLVLLVAAVVVSVALLSNRISARLRVPAPAIFLVAAAAASDTASALSRLSIDTVEQIVTVALILILFEGDMGIGVARLRVAWAPVLVVGVLGTLLTAAALVSRAPRSSSVIPVLGYRLAPCTSRISNACFGFRRPIPGCRGPVRDGNPQRTQQRDEHARAHHAKGEGRPGPAARYWWPSATTSRSRRVAITGRRSSGACHRHSSTISAYSSRRASRRARTSRLSLAV